MTQAGFGTISDDSKMCEGAAQRSRPILAIVVPCYNEAPLIVDTARKLVEILEELSSHGEIDSQSFIYFVDDGSQDETWLKICHLHQMNPQKIKGLKLARNFGSQSAILAGILSVRERAHCAITIDADLQQDERAIPLFLKSYKRGAEIVFGVRCDRSADSFWKKSTALIFYKCMKAMGVRIIENHADYRLISRKVIDSLAEFREYNLFLRGIFADLGFKTETVYFKAGRRQIGETKFSFKKMASLALNGITSFSVMPLRLISILGAGIFIFSCVMSIWILFKALFGKVVPGWASTLIPIYILGGLQIMLLGILGEYIGRIYKEVKARPRFIKDIELF